MTLGGLAAAVGLVIDDAIVVLENIVLHRDAGQNRFQAIASALREMWVPLVGSTITPIVVFLPLISIAGVTGSFFRALAITMTVALLVSLFLAMTWTPTLSQYFLKDQRKDGRGSRNERPSRSAALLAAEEAHLSDFWADRQFLRALHAKHHHRPLLLAVSSLVILLFLRLLPLSGNRPASEDGRRRFYSGLLHSAGKFADRVRKNSAAYRKILKATREVENTSRRYRIATGTGGSDRSQPRSFTVKLRAKRDRAIDE
jgi:multidrug efflux pump subunit AcrB